MDEVLRSINFNEWPFAAAAVIIVVALRPVLILWLGNIREDHQVERDQTKVLEDLKLVLEKTRDDRMAEREISRTLTATVAQLNEFLNGTQKQMNTWAKQTDETLTTIQTDVRGIPPAVWLAGEDVLADIRAALEHHIDDVEQRIIERLPSTAENAQETVKLELADIKGNTNTLLERLQSIERTLSMLLLRGSEAERKETP